MIQSYGHRYFFLDEMRAGTRTELKKRWTPRGHRPVIRIKLGYDFTYLYAALAPESGRLIALLLPDMTGESFELFLRCFEQQIQKLYRGRKTLLILDQAGGHKYKLQGKSNVMLHYLPTACPELNCVERLFEELRKSLSNHVFKDIEEVERFLCQVLKKYYQEPKLIVQLCYYPYMLHAKPK